MQWFSRLDKLLEFNWIELDKVSKVGLCSNFNAFSRKETIIDKIDQHQQWR
jgi:hypothetical protein